MALLAAPLAVQLDFLPEMGFPRVALMGQDNQAMI